MLFLPELHQMLMALMLTSGLCAFFSSYLFHLQPQHILVLDHVLKEDFVLMAKFDSSSCSFKCLFVFPSRYSVLVPQTRGSLILHHFKHCDEYCGEIFFLLSF